MLGVAPAYAKLHLLLERNSQRVLLDRDLAEIYGVTIGRLNEVIKRNKGRFPEDFMFQLTAT